MFCYITKKVCHIAHPHLPSADVPLSHTVCCCAASGPFSLPSKSLTGPPSSGSQRCHCTRCRLCCLLPVFPSATTSANCPLRKPCETCKNLATRKTYLRNLAKLVFAKVWKTRICETLRILRILRSKTKTAKLVFAKFVKHNLRNLAKHCETLIAKTAKVAKVELQCENITQITKHWK